VLLKLSRPTAAAVALCAMLAGCSDDPATAPGASAAPRQTQSGDQSFAYEAAEAPVEATTIMRPTSTGVAVWGAVGQAAVESSGRASFPLEGSRYLVVSSGLAESFDEDGDGANTVSHGSACDPVDRRCDLGGVDLALTLPSDAQSVEFGVRYYTWDFDGHLDPFRVYELTETGPVPRFEATTVTEFGGEFGGGLRYGPDRQVSLNVSGLPLQPDGTKLLKLRFEASDSPTGDTPDRTLDSGALIDKLRVLTASNQDRLAPVVRDVAANPSPVPYTQASAVTAKVDDAGSGGSVIASAEYSVDGGRYTPMTAVGSAFGTSATQAVSGALGASAVNFYVRTVCVRGQDGRGNAGTAPCVEQAVYDPAQNYVVGSGWFESLPGAYGDGGAADYQVRGRASFGFSTGHKPGAIAPTGETRFTFKAAGLAFKSTSNEYLYANGTEGRYKGKGELTLNGRALTDPATGGSLGGEAFGLLVAATDGKTLNKPDAVRVRIWRLSDGATVYDNHRACGVAEALPETATPGSYYGCTELRGGQMIVGSANGTNSGKKPRR
jgi:hypothetical protein